MDLDDSSVTFQLRELGFDHEAEYFQQLISTDPPPDPFIPTFLVRPLSRKHSSHKLLLQQIVHERIVSFRSAMFTSEDLQRFASHLGGPKTVARCPMSI
jgi:hypothetical protein